jgi:hypothetical protein
MRSRVKLGVVLAAVTAALGLGACGAGGPIRVYVEPTYEQDRLQKILATHAEFRVLPHPGTEDVTLRVEGVPRESPQAPLRATLRARHPARRYEVYAVAEFLPVRNGHGGRARWVASYADGVREDDVDRILFEIVTEAATQEHRHIQRPLTEVERALHSTTPAS